MSSCNICCSEAAAAAAAPAAANKKIVVCEHDDCTFPACVECICTWSTDKALDAGCIKCQRPWSFEFVQKMFPQEYKESRERVLIKREKFKLSQTVEKASQVQSRLNATNELKNAHLKLGTSQKEMIDMKRKIARYEYIGKFAFSKDDSQKPTNRLVREICCAYPCATQDVLKVTDTRLSLCKYLQTHMKLSERSVHEYAKELKERHRRLAELLKPAFSKHKATKDSIASSSPTTLADSHHILPCPDEACHGFLDGNSCKLCGIRTCARCRVRMETDASHTCDTDVVATFDMIRRDARLCPRLGCGALIHKESGCDQMFCTACHTLFSWNTGVIVGDKEMRHNPHYLDWNELQKKKSQSIGSIGSIGSIDNYINVIKHVRDNSGIENPARIRRMASAYYNACSEVRRFRKTRDGHEAKLEKHRIRYMLKDITEKQWGQTLYRSEKAAEKAVLFLGMFERFATSTKDALEEFFDCTTDSEIDARVIPTMNMLRSDFNYRIADACTNVHAKTTWNIDSDWNLIKTP